MISPDQIPKQKVIAASRGSPSKQQSAGGNPSRRIAALSGLSRERPSLASFVGSTAALGRRALRRPFSSSRKEKAPRPLRSKISRRLRFATFPLAKVHRGSGWLWSGRKTSSRSREFPFPLTPYIADDSKRTVPALHTQNLPNAPYIEPASA